MGMCTIVVLNNDCLLSLKNDKQHSIDTLLTLVRRGETGSFGPGAEVVAVRHHTFPGFFYFDGRTLFEMDDLAVTKELIARSTEEGVSEGSIFGPRPQY
jgi:hypothetical protein